MEGRNILFICGCPRSGTTAMWSLLTSSPDIVLGVERYGNIFSQRGTLNAGHFEKERFFDCRKGDTFYDSLEDYNPYYEAARHRFDGAALIGDKIPMLYMDFHGLAERFPGAKIIMMFRNIIDVAASYRIRQMDRNDTTWSRHVGVSNAISDWALSLRAYAENRDRLNIFPVVYEDFFHKAEGLEQVLAYLGMRASAELKEAFAWHHKRSDELEAIRNRELNMDEVLEIALTAPFWQYREIVRDARTTLREMQARTRALQPS